MSSINQNQAGYTNATHYTNAQPSTQALSTSDVSAVTGSQPASISLDSFAGQNTSTGADILSSRPPVATDARPVNYTTNLQSAQNNLSSFSSTGGGSAAEMALLAKENLATTKNSTAISDSQNREKKTTAQATSIIESAETSHKQHCKTKHDNHDDNLAKMKKLGFTPKQAEAMLRTLEDPRTSKDAKNKLAYQLAAIGMCGAHGTGLAKATASNVSAIKEQLGKFADGQSKALMSIQTETSALSATGKKLKGLLTPDMSTPFATSSSTSSLASAATNLQESGLSSATKNASAISSAALSAAYPNLTTVA